MSTFLIGYDLNQAGQDYTDLINEIKKLSGGTWCHPLDSTWLIKCNLKAVELRNQLQTTMDSNDDILVIDLTNDASAWCLDRQCSDWLLKHLYSGT